ncbi:hypothetical protein [Rhizobium gallicum]|uniref:hypothetical protein n=1 Tax=Rhizobium gallicum TaxID=56730 RepID=UPI001EF95CF5|nr:hypothetical protein [Rhizobium gallicum]ULJ71497.1 hypothetical protein L2W42_16870 [Rhizobium gallicum]
MFGPRVELTGSQLLQIVVVLFGLKALLHRGCRVHGGYDTGDMSVHFQRCRLVIRRLGDHLLKQVATNTHH